MHQNHIPWTIRWWLSRGRGNSFQRHQCHWLGLLLDRSHRWWWPSSQFRLHQSMRRHREFSLGPHRRAWPHAIQFQGHRWDRCHLCNRSMGRCALDFPMSVGMRHSSRCNRDVGNSWQHNAVFLSSHLVWWDSMDQPGKSISKNRIDAISISIHGTKSIAITCVNVAWRQNTRKQRQKKWNRRKKIPMEIL